MVNSIQIQIETNARGNIDGFQPPVSLGICSGSRRAAGIYLEH